MTAAGHGDPLEPGVILTLDDLAARLGWPRPQGRYARGRCPACGSSDGGWLTVGDGGRAQAGCWSCADGRTALAAVGIHATARGRMRLRPPPRDGRSTALDLVRDAAVLDAVYAVFARHLQMPPWERRRHLGERRGIATALQDRMSPLLRPLPTEPNARTWTSKHLVEDLRRVASDGSLARVPELSRRRSGGFTVMFAREKTRYWEPWRDELGRTVALRAYVGSEGDKYLTSPRRTGALVHFAFGVPPGDVATAPWLFTEGWMKAEVAAHQLGAVGVAFPGVTAKGSWARALEVKQRLAPDAAAYVAFDAEAWKTRLDIGVAALELAVAIERCTGRAAGFAVWDAHIGPDGKPAPKGIDDAIVDGSPVRLVDRHEFAGYVAPLMEEVEREQALRAAA